MPEAISQQPRKLKQSRLKRSTDIHWTFKNAGLQGSGERFSKNHKSVTP
jgi:hypothetical protein